MARTAPGGSIRTREKRLGKDSKKGERRWCVIQDGLALCYRRGAQGSGTWSARLKRSNGHYALRALGTADDYADANGVDVLTFAQAQRKALALQDDAKRDEGVITRPCTVKDAADHYLEWFRANRKSIPETEHTIRVHILPELQDRHIGSIQAPELRKWHGKLAVQPARVRSGMSRIGKQQKFKAAPKTADEKRARKVTANRILTVLKAILNKAFEDSLVGDNVEWRKVKPFKNVEIPRIRFLTDAEGVRLVNACPADLRSLVRGALLTGARYGELTALRVQDVNLKTAQIYLQPAKSDKARHLPLNPEGVELFRSLTTGRTGDALVFVKADGTPWGKNHHVRALLQACKVASIRPAVAFHELRHTYASHLAQAGVDLLTISKLLGHADTRVTERHYAHLCDKTLAAAVTKLPSFEVDRREVVAEVAGKHAA